MQKVRVIVTCKRKVVRHGVALILNNGNNLEVIGREGTDVLEEAVQLQPDLLFYELCSNLNDDHEILQKLEDVCSWTKIILFSTFQFKKEDLEKFLDICAGYVQGPILPGYLLKAVELACYSGYFFYLGFSDKQSESKNKVRDSTISRPVKIN